MRTRITATLAALTTLTVAGAIGTTTAATAGTETGEAPAGPDIASVTGAADVRLTYQRDDDIRSFAFDAHAAPYTNGPIPTADGRTLPGAPNDATGTVKITHHAAQWDITFTAEGRVDSMVTAPGYATLTAVITTVSPGGPDYWIGKRFGFSVYDAGKDRPRRFRDRVGFSWEFMNMTRNAKGEWAESEVGTSMAPAPFAPVEAGGYTVTHADLPPAPKDRS
ncbi:hypothetical protein GA0070606_5348 [Micromonospora citrea]|uniref:Uncharacterized protein n=1 Tax=Micromonospora citrea TaxID=47855 RepID=A0A1C6VVM5_9ACTN|nr:hypothetical protein [Micromonospora citrea]SCL70282.1 hypothetical protein GA0070606_5348 [Micromonospora citrea]